MKIISLITFVLIALLAVAGCQTKEKSSQSAIVVGTNAEFAPFSFIEGGAVQGFDIDIANEVARRNGWEIRLENLPFDALIPALQLGSVDFVAAGMSITEERQKAVDFSLPYLDAVPLCAVYLEEKGPIEELRDKSLVVNEGYTADYWVTDVLQIEPLRLGNPLDALMALQSGRAEVFVTAKNTVSPLLQTGQKLSTFDIPGTGENCALMFRKGSGDLQEKVKAALQEMIDDGTIQALKEKWGLAS